MRSKEKAAQSEEDNGAEDWKWVGKGGAVDFGKLIETGLLIFQDG